MGADKTVDQPGVSRRTFLGAGLASGAALLTGGVPAIASTVRAATGAEPWIEANIPQLRALMASGQLSSRELTLGYLDRIRDLNPTLGAVIETNPTAVATAARLDTELKRGLIRGPLHGIPILLKDNIATDDNMQTTAGSLALVNSRVPADAPIVAKLRDAGAVILGKANLSEWANFRGFAPFNGWSARGGFTRDPYLLSFDPCGSSSGSGVAPAANLCAAAVGTETDGSIVCPAGEQPGRRPQADARSPVAGRASSRSRHSQDTAGPMCRTVTDVAILLGVMQSPFGPVLGHTVPANYTQFLQRGALKGKRIGVDQRYFTEDYGGEPDSSRCAMQGIAAMEQPRRDARPDRHRRSVRLFRRRVHGVAVRVQGATSPPISRRWGTRRCERLRI